MAEQALVRPEPLEGLGRVFARPLLIPNLTVRENIVFPWLLHEIVLEEDHFAQVIDYLDLVDWLDAPAGAVPPEAEPRVSFARALAGHTPVVLVDAAGPDIPSLLIETAGRLGQRVVRADHATPQDDDDDLPASLDDIAPPPRLSNRQEDLVNAAREILETLPGSVVSSDDLLGAGSPLPLPPEHGNGI